MEQFVGLDVSQKLTHVCVVDQKGSVVWQEICLSIPEDIAVTVRARAPHAGRAMSQPRREPRNRQEHELLVKINHGKPFVWRAKFALTNRPQLENGATAMPHNGNI
ncbi:MAG: hypothetical protein JOZ17_12305 [Acetobacteraceae bacterium]|nr:hypothetical protein [Acetobacteraceae bacterium]